MNEKKYNLDEIKQKIEKAKVKAIKGLVEDKEELENEMVKFAMTMNETIAISAFISHFLESFENEED